jgi:hypothetical protein
MGGVVISAAAELSPRSFKSLVFVTAFVPKNGSALAELAAEVGGGPAQADGAESTLERETARHLFYGDCSAEVAN